MAKTSFRFSLRMLLIAAIGGAILLSACQKKPTEETSGGKYLYVASGACYAATGVTTFNASTSSNLVFRIDTETGKMDMKLADYASSVNAGDTPTGLINVDSENIYVAVENATTTSLRRIEKVPKQNLGARSTYVGYTTLGLPAAQVVRSMTRSIAGDLIVARSNQAEYITSAGIRFGNPFINPNSGTSCGAVAATNIGITKAISLSNGGFIFLNTHATATNNRIFSIGLAGGATCQTYMNTPSNAYPTSAVYDSANQKLIVSYSGTTGALNSIHLYTVNESTGVLSGDRTIYDSSQYPATYPYLLYAIPEMALDTAKNTLYVATAITNANTVVNYAIEKFTYDPAQADTHVLTRVGSVPFYTYGSDTKCVSSMMLAD